MGFRVVVKVKDLNKERIPIKRGEQKHIPVNQEIKESIIRQKAENETQAETINRVLKTNEQMTDLLITMVKSMEEIPNKMTEILNIIPNNLKNLFEAVRNEKRDQYKEKGAD